MAESLLRERDGRWLRDGLVVAGQGHDPAFLARPRHRVVIAEKLHAPALDDEAVRGEPAAGGFARAGMRQMSRQRREDVRASIQCQLEVWARHVASLRERDDPRAHGLDSITGVIAGRRARHPPQTVLPHVSRTESQSGVVLGYAPAS